ncbi:MAG: PilZ domain-containing protein [Desulfomonilaceae bacterium]
MTVRKVPLREVLHDIRSGMDETAIRRKYNLSFKGLQRLYEKLIEARLLRQDQKPVRRKLNIGEVLTDIRKGMDDSDLMKKYELSVDMLRQLSKKLLDARGKRTAEDGLDTIIEERMEFLATREFVRHEVDFEVLVYEASRPEIHGTLRDISEEGAGVAGIEASRGQVKTLVVLGDELGEFSTFEFQAYCRWCLAEEEIGTCLTGFAISKISDSDLQQLRKLLRLIAVGG